MTAKGDLEQKCINTIRGLSMDGVQQAKSGHPGMPMGMADVAFVLWTEYLAHNPVNPQWFNRDRFILSAGHGSMLLYSLLHLTGYPLGMDQLKQFRQWNSKTPGHPEYGHTEGVETTTGPLGQGFANAVGFAIAETHLADVINTGDIRIVDHYTYVIASDGDLMEGISHEAASLAGHLKLGKLVVYYDDNGISIDGPTDLSFSEDVQKRFEAYDWHCIRIDGHNTDEIRHATEQARAETDKPTLILCKTTIGFGSPNKQGSAASHGAPLGEDEVRLAKQHLGLDPDKTFHVEEQVADYFLKSTEKGVAAEQKWHHALDKLSAIHPEKPEHFHRLTGLATGDLAGVLPEFAASEKGMATRSASGKVIEALMARIPCLMGGSADLTPSNNTLTSAHTIYSDGNRKGRYIHFGVREHAMWAAMNGMALHGGIRPYGGTFLIFSDYCRPSIRMAALSNLPVIGVFTHDSVGLGEDGPTHQPVEQLASLRAIPNVVVLRPCDANETAVAWKVALERLDGPTLLALTRQNVPVLDRTVYASASGVEKGAYILAEASGEIPDLIFVASGSEVQHALGARTLLESEGVQTRVVSMPSWELFRRQSEEYRLDVLGDEAIPKISVEAGLSMGWHEFIGADGLSISLDQFGTSAPYETIMEKLGFTPQNLYEEALAVLEQRKSKI